MESIFRLHCTENHNTPFRDLKVNHLEQTIKSCKADDVTKGRIRNLFNMMSRYATIHEACEKNYAEMSNAVKEPKSKIIQTIFSNDETKTCGNTQVILQ